MKEGQAGGQVPRVAFFADSFHEVNGVALTSREFHNFAQSRFFPFFSVHAGPKTGHWKRGTLETYELAPSRLYLPLEHDLKFDLLGFRHRKALGKALRAFKPDLVHVTGPSHLGLLGTKLAYELGVPLAASWHTNIHEFGSRRMRKLLGKMPERWVNPVADWAEAITLNLSLRFYKLAHLLFAPNPELVELIGAFTGRPVHLMQRGIDVNLFSPSKRPQTPAPFTIGYVGRLSAEKNVRLFAAIEPFLIQAGVDYRFLIVGEGSERAWLKENLQHGEVPGIRKDEALAAAYASMDLFVFPSETDTFGNVVQEAMASGVPAIVSDRGGPKFLVREGVTGFVTRDPAQIAQCILQLIQDPVRLQAMREAARQAAEGRSWSAVFEGVYEKYRRALTGGNSLPSSVGSPSRVIPSRLRDAV